MLKIFRSYTPYSVLALLVTVVVFKLFWLIHPEAAIVLPHQKTFKGILSVIRFMVGKSPITMTFLAMVNVAGQALFINRIARNNKLFEDKHYLPAFCFILISSLLPQWNYLSAPLLANWLILIALKETLKLQNRGTVQKLVFNIGFAIGCATLLTPSTLIFLIFLFIALVSLRSFKPAEWLISLLGFLTPFYFLAALLFIAGDISRWQEWLPMGIGIIHDFSMTSLKPYVSLALALILLCMGFLFLNNSFNRKFLQQKKSWGLIIACFGLSLVPLFFDGLGGLEMAFPVLLFFSLIAANSFVVLNKRWPGKILFYLSVAVLIFAEWIPLTAF